MTTHKGSTTLATTADLVGGSIESSVGYLEALIDTLGEAVDRLHSRISPILSHSDELIAPDPLDEPDSSTLRFQINNAASRVTALSALVDHLVHRVDL